MRPIFGAVIASRRLEALPGVAHQLVGPVRPPLVEAVHRPARQHARRQPDPRARRRGAPAPRRARARRRRRAPRRRLGTARPPRGRRGRRTRGRATTGPGARRRRASRSTVLVADRRRRAATCGRGRRDRPATSRQRAASATVVVTTPTTEVWRRHRPGVRHAAEARLVPDEAAERGGDADRAAAVAGRRRAGRSPAATAAAEPLDEPPGVRSRFHGLRVTPHALVLGEVEDAELGRRRLARPARRRRPAAGRRRRRRARPAVPPLNQSEPCDVGMPAQSWRSFTPSGTPASGPGSSPRATAVVDRARPRRGRCPRRGARRR